MAFRFVGCVLLLAVVCIYVAAAPPLVSHLQGTKESYSDVYHSSNGEKYTVVLAHIPLQVTADDFDVRIIDNRILKVEVKNTTIDWYMNLVQPVPDELKLTPIMEVEQLRGDETGAAWMVSVLIPKYFYPVLQGPQKGVKPEVVQPAPGIMAVPVAPPVASPVAHPVAASRERVPVAFPGMQPAQVTPAAAQGPSTEYALPGEKTVRHHLPKPVAGPVKYPIPLFDG